MRPLRLLASILLAAASPHTQAAHAQAEGLNPEHEGYPLYQRYCAECHGLRADGNGPRAARLESTPPDLTRIAVRGGETPRLDAVVRFIDGRRDVRAHEGTNDMPVWGEQLLADLPDSDLKEWVRVRLVQSLAEYLLSIQRQE